MKRYKVNESNGFVTKGIENSKILKDLDESN